jgi:hypothetical protein
VVVFNDEGFVKKYATKQSEIVIRNRPPWPVEET